MKSLLLALLGSTVMAHAAERATDFLTALETAKAKRADVALLLHGTGWCKPGERIAAAWRLPSTASGLPSDIILADYDKPDTVEIDDKKEPSALDKQLPHVRSYPALVLLDSKGRIFAMREGVLNVDNPANNSEWIKRAVSMRRARDEDWAAAEKLQGPNKALKLGQGLDRMGLELGPKKIYQSVLDDMEKADPEDKSGYVGKYTFPGLDFAAKIAALAEDKKFDEAEKLIATWAANSRLNIKQKQQLLAGRFALYQRWPEKKDQSKKVLEEICRLDPKSEIGQGAAVYLKNL